MKNYLLKGIEKISHQLDIEFGYTAANHNFELGVPLENALREWFRPYFPERYAFGSGYLVDCNGKKSNQSDWVIYDPIHFSPLIRKAFIQDGVEFYPYDSVYGVVEVKRTLTKDVIEKAISQLSNTRSLSRSPSDPSFVNPLLSYRAVLKADVSDIPTNHFISAIYAYNQDDKSLPSNGSELCSYLADTYSYEDLPDIIAIHGQFLVFKTSCQNSEDGKTKYLFSYHPNERNAISCKDSDILTSGYFYTLLLSMLQNTFLNAVDFNSALYSIISDIGGIHCKLGKNMTILKGREG